MFTATDELNSYIVKHGIRQIDLKFTDLYGGLHHMTVSTHHVDPKKIDKGTGFDASSIPGFKAVESGDMVLKPLLDTGWVDPFFQVPTLSFFCDVVEPDTHAGFARDPRSILRRAHAHMVSSGLADASQWGPEFEFYLFERVSYKNGPGVAHYDIASEEADVGGLSASTNAPELIPAQRGYLVAPDRDRYLNVRSEMSDALQSIGVPVKYHHHEVGAAGQSEIELEQGPLLESADRVQIVKYFVKQIAKKHGLTATFMPKPLYNVAGSGMHFHQHLFKGSKPVFYKKGGYADFSPEGLSYIAGVLRHGPAILAFTNPSTNSFKRLVPGFEAPVQLFFSLANRSAAIRIPKYARDPHDKRFEFRPPDATCNPYLAMAAMLAAGVDGMRQKLDPSALGFGPYDENIFETGRADLKSLPTSLEAALDALEADHAFLTDPGIVTSDTVTAWIKAKREREVNELQRRPHPYEFELYYNC
jgi:glutamine synthetase